MTNRVNWNYYWNGLSAFNSNFEQKISLFENSFPELLAYHPPSLSLIQRDSNGFPIIVYRGDKYIYETQKMRLPRKKYRSMSDFKSDMLNTIDLKIIRNWKDGQYDQFFSNKFCHSSPYNTLKDKDFNNKSEFDDDFDNFDDIINDIKENDECSEYFFDDNDNWKQSGINDNVTSIVESSDSIFPYKVNTQEEDRKTCFVAFYSPFHLRGIQAGIYYSSYGIVNKAKFFVDLSLNMGWKYSKEDCYIIAKIMTFYHEFFHHKIEAMASRIEITLRKRFYIDGFSKYYNKNSIHGNKCYEETLANLYSYIETLSCLQPYYQKRDLHKIMVMWMKSQPKSYRNALKFIRIKKDDNSIKINILRNKYSELIFNYFNKWEGLQVNKKSFDIWNVFTYSHSPFTWKETNINYLF